MSCDRPVRSAAGSDEAHPHLRNLGSLEHSTADPSVLVSRCESSCDESSLCEFLLASTGARRHHARSLPRLRLHPQPPAHDWQLPASAVSRRHDHCSVQRRDLQLAQSCRRSRRRHLSFGRRCDFACLPRFWRPLRAQTRRGVCDCHIRFRSRHCDAGYRRFRHEAPVVCGRACREKNSGCDIQERPTSLRLLVRRYTNGWSKSRAHAEPWELRGAATGCRL
mmetsp:Transcript_59865/g.112599  ORF Transcript_59865/g.112599 Transcript_59865/m.112599 type:complete len:222 (-) Transcript_59865:1154-1819(-)